MPSDLAVAFVGAGAINFGGLKGAWDHASRLEKIGGTKVVALVDPDTGKAEQVLQARKQGVYGRVYKGCRVYSTVHDFLSDGKADVLFLGIPPLYRGSPEKDKRLELDIVEAGIHLFVEKPLSVTALDKFVEYPKLIKEAQERCGVQVSVGYMFRYHAAVLKMKELIAGHGGKVMPCTMKYYHAYADVGIIFWWDKSQSGGTIVEQATHFCDLARYLVGKVDEESLQVQCLREGDPGGAGRISRVPPGCEDSVPSAERIPRVTMANWKFVDGGLGSLVHAVALHGQQYETHIDILMDGLRLSLSEPYTEHCQLKVRDGRSGSDDDVILDFGHSDPYETEIRVFLDAVRSGDGSKIASSYEDASKTYSLTWAIRKECEVRADTLTLDYKI